MQVNTLQREREKVGVGQLLQKQFKNKKKTAQVSKFTWTRRAVGWARRRIRWTRRAVGWARRRISWQIREIHVVLANRVKHSTGCNGDLSGAYLDSLDCRPDS
jgi:hypothetical protein